MTPAATGANPALWLVRHAPVPGAEGRCYGASDWPADAGATAAIAQRLHRALPRDSAIRYSPLRRCAQLADALHALRPEITPVPDPRLREMDFGAWEGRRWNAIPRADFERWQADFAGTPPSPGAETMAAFMHRVGAAWDAWRVRPSPALWITHAGVIRALLLQSRGVRAARTMAEWPRDAIAHGVPVLLRAAC